MFAKKAFPWIMNFWFSVFMTSIMTIVFTIYNTGSITPIQFLDGFWKGFLVSYLVGSVVPLGKLGAMLAQKIKAKPGSLAFNLISGIPSSVLLDVIMCFAFTYFAIGMNYGLEALIFGALGSIPLGFVVAYPCSILLTPVALKLTNLMTQSAQK